jgi:sulfonate transport system substrate-binding protein
MMGHFARIVVGLALLLGAGLAHGAEPVKIRIGWVVVPPELTPILFAKQGIAPHQGKSYVLVPSRFTSSSPMIEAMAIGDLDVAGLTFFSFATAIANAHLDDLRVIADEFQDGVEGYFSAAYLVRNDSGITKIEDLKGKAIASYGVGSQGDMAIRVMLRKHGLEANRDYTVIEARPPTHKAMLLEHKVDMIIGQGITYYEPELQKQAHPLFTTRDALGKIQGAMFTARTGVLAQHRAAYVDFLEDTLRAVRWYNDQAHHDAAIDILANFSKVPRAQLEGWAFTARDEYRDPNGLPDLDSLQRIIDTANEMAFLKANVDAKKHADLSLVEEAARRLK